jgi:hypothetical protein
MLGKILCAKALLLRLDVRRKKTRNRYEKNAVFVVKEALSPLFFLS